MDVVYYNRSVMKFVDAQERQTRAKIIREISLLREFGYMLGMPYSRKILSNLFELRIRGRQEIRLFYTWHQGKGVLLSGFVKKTQKTPSNELETAITRLRTLTEI